MKVIIRGHVFDYAEKAPFVVSGKSALGALEYDDQAEKIKCHECGRWFASVSDAHVRTHDISVSIYKLRHGLNQTTKLLTPESKEKRKRQAERSGLSGKAALTRFKSGPRVKRRIVKGHPDQTESANEKARCKAQTLFRLQVLAAGLGRTPTVKEIEGAGIQYAVHKHFGELRVALESAGLLFRNHGRSKKSSDCALPIGFPTKMQLDDTRMPWPKEYFGAGAIALERRNS